LSRSLSIQVIDVVVRDSWDKSFDAMSKGLTTKARLSGYVEREVEAGHFPGYNLGGSDFDPGWSQEVQSTEIVAGAPNPGSVNGSTRNPGKVSSGREGG
jgi:hypothetical protein